MKTKKLLSLLVGIILIVSCFSFSTTAASGIVTFSSYINDVDVTYSNSSAYPEEIKMGSNFTISIKDVQLDYVDVESSQTSYEWFKYDSSLNRYDIIPNENASSIALTFDGCTQYLCAVIVGDDRSYRDFYFKEDTLTVVPSSSCTMSYDDEMFSYIISPGLAGAEGNITISAESVVPNATITYQWEKAPYFIYPTEFYNFETLPNTTNSENFQLTAGGFQYWCTVSDGKTSKYLNFVLFPDETITMNNSVNGKVPTTYAGTYILVKKPNEKITVDVTSTSTFGDVKYTWFKQNQEDYSFSKLDLTTGVLEVLKSEPTDNDPFAVQPYECYIEDGNQLIRYQILFFCLDPETPFSEIEKKNDDTPDISFASDNENLANTLLSGDELESMAYGMSASVGLSAELKNTIDESDKTAINAKLEDDQNIGMHLEMNLQKDIMGEKTFLTELNGAIELSVDMPENLINKDTTVDREYQVIRMHNGEAEVLDCQFDEENESLNFKTDKFSLYTITYKDVAKKSTETTTTPEPTPTTETKPTPEASVKPEGEKTPSIPGTGDTTNLELWIALFLISILSVTSVMLYSKKVR